VHELEHVWQYQKGVNVILEALPLQIIYWATFRLIDVYSLPSNPVYSQLSVEQQGDFAWLKYQKYKLDQLTNGKRGP
jgi:hypothetical protein